MKKLFHFLLKKFDKKVINLNTNKTNLVDFLNLLHPKNTEHNLIRVGSEFDGGYLLPNDLLGISTCFSPGVSDNSKFEDELSKKYNIKSYLCDFSVEKPSIDNKQFFFDKLYLDVTNTKKTIRMEDWFKKYSDGSNSNLLQMDIEGSEYKVILDTPTEILKNFRILIIEFHDFDLLFHEIFFQTISAVFEKLLIDFEIIHLHPNNCCGTYEIENIEIPKVIEFTFINRNRLKKESYPLVEHLNNSLDAKNTRDKEDINFNSFFKVK
jgi:hypothetical protein